MKRVYNLGPWSLQTLNFFNFKSRLRRSTFSAIMLCNAISEDKVCMIFDDNLGIIAYIVIKIMSARRF